MEEEGTVVYFKTSPSVRDLHEDEELVYREEWDTGSSEAAKFDDDRLPTAHGHDSTGSVELSASDGGRGAILSLFSDMRVIAKRWLYPTDQHDQIVRHRDKLLDSISNSPLLTEDDFQLVQYIMSYQTQLSSTKHSQHHNSHLHPSYKHTVFFLTALLVGITAAATALLPIQFIFVLSILAIVIGGIPLTLRWRMKLAVEQSLGKSMECLEMYLREFEMLLSLVSQTTKLIRETEIISHGFTRPSGVVPISKLELQGSTDLQCPLLRKKLFSICQDGVCSLRRVTQWLCTEYSSKEEFDSHDGYLAFRQLSTLHQFMRDDVEGAEDELAMGEMKDDPSFESLESLKDASNLLAVQNSEMLKRLTIVTSFALDNESTMGTAAVDSLSPLHMFIHEASNSLRWSMDFHKNYLFNEPPTHKRVVTVSEGTSPTIAHPLESVVHEVHCMDLKTQVALQRVRTLGSWLSKQCDKSEREEIVSETVECLRQQLSTIEQDLHGVVDHITACYQSLDNVGTKPGDGQGIISSSETKGESTDFTEGEETTQAAHGAEEECSDDEMVFEAYVSPTDVIEDWDDLPLDDEDVKNQKESKENSIHMIRELNSVLAVRNIEKQRKREIRERKKQQGGLLSPSDASVSHNSWHSADRVTKIQEMTTADSHESGAMESQIAKSDGIESKSMLPMENQLSSGETMESKFELPFDLPSREERLDNSVLSSSAIAQAVAAIALKAGRANKEELFHDDQDSNSTTSEAETA